MARTKRVLFERLAWENGALAPCVPTLAVSEDAEAAAALMALGGFQCQQCKGALSAADGYACCYHPHCPYCGRCSDDWNGECMHLALEYGRKRWTPRLYGAFKQQGDLRGDDEKTVGEVWRTLLEVKPPARRLPNQRKPGYPRWSQEQITSAYSPDVVPHLETIFSPTLRKFHFDRCGPVLLGVLRPNIKTQVSDRYRHWRDCYFCADPLPAIARVEAFLTHLHDGTDRLRALPPETLVRPPYDLPTTAREAA